MKVTQLVVSASLVLASTAVPAQFVTGNEAVRVMPDGNKRVDTPPLPPGLGPPCPASRAGCASGGWLMVETASGLMECTEFYARPGTCRTSTYGAQKFARLWIVKMKSEWKQCQFPDLGSKCVSTKAMPFDAVQ